MSDIIPDVERLIRVCRDGEELFRYAASRVSSSKVKALLEEYAEQRRSFLRELQTEAIAFGESEPTESGTVTGTLQRSWVKLRDSVTNPTEQAILEECEREEDEALAAYRTAVELGTLPDALRDLVARQYAEVNTAHGNVRDLRDKSRSP